MMTITNPNLPPGAVIHTHKGNIGIVQGLQDERVIIRVPEGRLKRIPLSSIARWELPTQLPPAEDDFDQYQDLSLDTLLPNPIGTAQVHPSPLNSALKPGDRCTYYGIKHRGIGGMNDLIVVEVEGTIALVKNNLWMFEPIWIPMNELGVIRRESRKDVEQS